MITYRVKNKIVVRRTKGWSMGGRKAALEPGDERTHAVGFAMPDPPEDYWDAGDRRVGFVFRRPR